ncbi:putative NAD(P)-binding protein [Balneicella halophila]|uniref:Putative NAD(P)-binding protein n=1 Tax=Balneicella halophila TaxID=1537566 RepID=A0A7L4UNY2_BALHA|nr:NAD(P)H-binding protein [Balneicella halophila]PVX50818.1 putative NAD(P)-binding protein [Balneicella halophila]
MMAKTAILLGGTGLTGRHLLELLLNSAEYDKIKVYTRRPTGVKHSKLQETICDLLELEEQESSFYGDVVFCCIGTTKKKTPDKKKYKAIDYGIPSTASRLASKNKIGTFVVISALGADKGSYIFYNKTKGQMEEAVLASAIKNTLIYRPSFIYGEREENRIGEKIGIRIAKVFNPLLIGKLKKYKAISATNLAKAMYDGALFKSGHHIIFRDEM